MNTDRASVGCARYEKELTSRCSQGGARATHFDHAQEARARAPPAPHTSQHTQHSVRFYLGLGKAGAREACFGASSYLLTPYPFTYSN